LEFTSGAAAQAFAKYLGIPHDSVRAEEGSVLA
jgi:hypothetical protein